MRDRGPDPTSMAAAVHGRNAGVTVDMSRQSGRWAGRSVAGGGLIDGDDMGGGDDGLGDLPYDKYSLYIQCSEIFTLRNEKLHLAET